MEGSNSELVFEQLNANIEKGHNMQLAPDVLNKTIVEEALKDQRFDVLKWLMDQELIYMCLDEDKTYTLLNIKRDISNVINSLHRFGYFVVSLDLRYASLNNAIGQSPEVACWLIEHGADIEEEGLFGYTPLYEAMFAGSIEIARCLFQQGADVNARDLFGNTPLHYAVDLNVDFARSLIEWGCDIDAQNSRGGTPLHCAVDATTLESVCMLLYYNADVELVNDDGLTAFMYSLWNLKIPLIQEVLLDFVVDINRLSSFGISALYYALDRLNPIAGEIVRRGGDVNQCPLCIDGSLHLSLKYYDMNVFKIIFPSFNMKLLDNNFFSEYLTAYHFPRLDWLKHLYLLLKSELVDNLVFDVIVEKKNRNRVKLFKNLLATFHDRYLELNDRLAIIKLTLERGIPIDLEEISFLYRRYGFHKEFELLFEIDFNLFETNSNSLSYMVRLILDFSLCDDVKTVLDEHCSLNLTTFDRKVSLEFSQEILPMARFFSVQQNILRSSPFLHPAFRDVVDVMPTVPSLKELSRNKTRAAIALKFPGEAPAFYQKYISQLPVPGLIQDIIRLKVPIYDNLVPLFSRSSVKHCSTLHC